MVRSDQQTMANRTDALSERAVEKGGECVVRLQRLLRRLVHATVEEAHVNAVDGLPQQHGDGNVGEKADNAKEGEEGQTKVPKIDKKAMAKGGGEIGIPLNKFNFPPPP